MWLSQRLFGSRFENGPSFCASIVTHQKNLAPHGLKLTTSSRDRSVGQMRLGI